MAWLGTKLGGYLAAAGGFIVLLLGVYYKGRKSKSDEVQAKTAESIIEITKEAKKIEKVNSNRTPDNRRKRLRDKYTRPSK